MSNPGIASSAEGLRSRRLACDRCRAQKLKCVRPERSETCQRCVSAKAVCNFGRPLPPGRVPTVRNFARDARADNSETVAAAPFRQRETVVSNLTLALQPVLPEEHAADPGGLPTPGEHHALDAGYPEKGWPQESSLDDESLFSVLYDDSVMVDLDAAAFAIWPTAAAKAMEESSLPTMEQPRGSSRDSAQLTDTEMSGAPAAESEMPLPGQRTGLMIHTALDSRQDGSESSPSPGRPQQGFISPLSGASFHNGPQPMQRLMHLGSIMYELQAMYSPDEHGNRPVPLTTFPTELAGKVLQASTEFLKSLQCFSSAEDSPPRAPSSSSTPPPLGHGQLPMPYLGDGDDRPYQRPLDPFQCYPDSITISRSSSAVTSAASSYASGKWPPPRRGYVADKPTALQLIANYLRLLQLYVLLYDAVYVYVRVTESDIRHSQPIWTDLAIGGTSICQFADLQIKLVLQVAARLLEEIEAALGLLEGCRVSKKSATEGSGILEAKVTAHFIEMCTSETTTEAEQGRGIIVKLRDLMNRLKNILNSPVWL